MARTVGIGHQNFEKIRVNDYFYVDKTSFLKEWWERGDEVTLKICQLLADVYSKHSFLLESDRLNAEEKEHFRNILGYTVSLDMPEVIVTMALHKLSEYLFKCFDKKVIILLDEYDKPMQEAYMHGYWEELASFTRSLFNAAFKNESLSETRADDGHHQSE